MSEYKYLSPAHLICFGLCQFYSIAAFESTLHQVFETFMSPAFGSLTGRQSKAGGYLTTNQFAHKSGLCVKSKQLQNN